MMQPARYIWMNGEIVGWNNAHIHVLTPGLHYGIGVFEGIRAYRQTCGGGAVFRLHDHIRRLFDGAERLALTIPFEPEDLEAICLRVLAINELTDAYLRPIVFIGEGSIGVGVSEPIFVAVAAFPWGDYLGKEAFERGIRATISPFLLDSANRFADVKACGKYFAHNVAKREAAARGFAEAIMCYQTPAFGHGNYLAEGTGENLFLVVGDSLAQTPSRTAPILPGITRDTVMTLLRDDGRIVIEQEINKKELRVSYEAFFTGTAVEVIPVASVDDRPIGAGTPGPITRWIQERFRAVVRGEIAQYKHWLTEVKE